VTESAKNKTKLTIFHHRGGSSTKYFHKNSGYRKLYLNTRTL